MSLLDGNHGLVKTSLNKIEFSELICAEISKSYFSAIADKGEFNLCLSGGNTPLLIFEKLLSSNFGINWNLVNFFWLDERFVPHSSNDSNFGNAKRFFIDFINPKNVYPIGFGEKIEVCSSDYNSLLKQVLPKDRQCIPIFDLILLGFGLDGHVASIFPGTKAIGIEDKFCIPVLDNPSSAKRITLTFPLINNSIKNLFMVFGSDKINFLKKILVNDSKKPINNIDFINTNTVWVTGVKK